jgi:drug/metabolite transporter (DMT)-like permease
MWILFTLLAALMQSFRNALKSRMSLSVSATGTTLARFLFAWPIIAVYLLALYFFLGEAFSSPSLDIAPYVATTAFFQILATILMVRLFKKKNYAVGSGLAKSEALCAAFLGVLFFSSQLSAVGFIGVILGFIAVFLMSTKAASGRPSFSTLFLGLACGISFSIASLMVREASLVSGLLFPYSAAWILLIVIAIQVIVLSCYLVLREPGTISQLIRQWPQTSLISLTSALGSIGWFSAMTLMDVAYVKTLGQIEVLFTMVIARFMMNQQTHQRDYWGLLLIGISSVMVILTTGSALE